MSKLDLNNYYNELTFKTWSNLLFYVPIFLFESDILEERSKTVMKNVFDQKLLIISESINIYEFDLDTDGNKFMKQITNLREIIFDLIQMKSVLKEIEFSYLLDKYYEQAEGALYVANWIRNNTSQIRNLDNKILGIFTIQFNSYRKHFEDFVKQFYPNQKIMPNDRLDVLHLIKTNFKNIKSDINLTVTKEISELNSKKEYPISSNDFFDNLLEKTKEYNPNKTVKPKQKILVSEQQAEKAILNQIFNIQE